MIFTDCYGEFHESTRNLSPRVRRLGKNLSRQIGPALGFVFASLLAASSAFGFGDNKEYVTEGQNIKLSGVVEILQASSWMTGRPKPADRIVVNIHKYLYFGDQTMAAEIDLNADQVLIEKISSMRGQSVDVDCSMSIVVNKIPALSRVICNVAGIERHRDLIAMAKKSMPDSRALAIANQDCKNVGMAAGEPLLTQECIRKNDEGWNQLNILKEDDSIYVSTWALCANSAAVDVTSDFAGWAQCVRFSQTICPSDAKGANEEQWKKCVRVISTGMWRMNKQSMILAEPASHIEQTDKRGSEQIAPAADSVDIGRYVISGTIQNGSTDAPGMNVIARAG